MAFRQRLFRVAARQGVPSSSLYPTGQVLPLTFLFEDMVKFDNETNVPYFRHGTLYSFLEHFLKPRASKFYSVIYIIFAMSSTIRQIFL